MITRGIIVLAAGGTGGHVFPAQALAESLASRGWGIALLTDMRGTGFGEAAQSLETYRIRAEGIGGGAWNKIKGLALIGLGYLQARRLLRRLAPSAAVGFGGYPSLPTMWAATSARIPTIIHEQNAILGRANRILAGRVDQIATSFTPKIVVTEKNCEKAILTGNPVRAAVKDIATRAYPRRESVNTPFNLLVFGGSQGARILSAVVPAAVAGLPTQTRRLINVVQQCRPEDIDRTRLSYEDASVKAELKTFFKDMPHRLSDAHLVIARSGASTIAEITTAGRPIIMVPYKRALDDHQTANARAISRISGGWIIPEDQLTAAALADKLQNCLVDPDLLAQTADRARNAGHPEAAERLADLTDALARQGQKVWTPKENEEAS